MTNQDRDEGWSNKVYASIKNNKDWRPEWHVNWKTYKRISGLVKAIKIEKKTIVPKDGTNAGKEIPIKNLVLEMTTWELEFDVQVNLYSQQSRSIINALAGRDPIDMVYLSVYNNKNGFRTLTVKKEKTDEPREWFYTPFYNYEEEIGLVETKIVQWEEKKDYDWLTDKYIKELIPIIEEKLKNQFIEHVTKPTKSIESEVAFGETSVGEASVEDKLRAIANTVNTVNNDDLPF